MERFNPGLGVLCGPKVLGFFFSSSPAACLQQVSAYGLGQPIARAPAS
jgi:hypothetical protein